MKTKQLNKIEWKEVELKDLGELIMGQSPKGDSYNNKQIGIPLLNGAADFKNNKIAPKQFTSSPTKLSKKGDLLFCIRATIGKTIISDGEYCLGRGVAGFRVNDKLVESRFLLKILNNKLKKLVLQGSTILGVKAKDIESIKIPLPFLNEKPNIETQKRIVSILEKAEKQIKKCEKAEKLLDEYLKSVFYEMFERYLFDRKKYKKISEFVSSDKNSIKAGPFGSSLKKESYVKKGYKIYGQEQVIRDDLSFGDYYISKDKFDKLKNYQIKEGDVLISLVGTYGKVSVIPKNFKKGIINPRLMKISLEKSKMDPIFFKFLFGSRIIEKELQDLSHGATMNIVNVRIIKKIGFPLPPLNLQKKFVEVIRRVEKMKQHIKKTKQNAEELFDSLMSKAFRGKL